MIGEDEAIATPFGLRRVTYADYTASGRSLGFIEDMIRDAVLPLYANTHTESSGTGSQTTRFREEARDIIRAGVGADPTDHVVLFCGSGSTGAINTFIGCLGLRRPGATEEHDRARECIRRRPVVFVGPYEHHSNELPWRESIADVVTVPEDADGRIDLDALGGCADGPRRSARGRSAAFSAASNVTGIVSDVAAISTILHRIRSARVLGLRGGGALRRSSTCREAAPTDRISTRSSSHRTSSWGARVRRGCWSPAGSCSPTAVPSVPGGGTVAYVNPTDHRYVDDIERREEGGTPDIVGSIRAGLVFQLKEAVGVEAIRERE